MAYGFSVLKSQQSSCSSVIMDMPSAREDSGENAVFLRSAFASSQMLIANAL
jgi:hypothetical protein